MKVRPGYILAEHLWRKDKKGKPMQQTFWKRAWDKMPPYRGEDPTNPGGQTVDIPKQGWKKIDPDSLIEPQAAKEAKENQESEDDGPEQKPASTRRRRKRS